MGAMCGVPRLLCDIPRCPFRAFVLRVEVCEQLEGTCALLLCLYRCSDDL